MKKKIGTSVPPQYATPPMPECQPCCRHRVEIKLSRDHHIYDVNVDGRWMFSRASYKNVLTELEKRWTR